MTRRILAGFLLVLLALLALVVVPLGATLSAQDRRDFVRAAEVAARRSAALAEERLGDQADAQDAVGVLTLPVDAGDGVVLLNRAGRTLSTAGQPVAPSIISAVRAGRQPRPDDAVVRTVVVGDPTHPDGSVILVRDSAPIDRRIHGLWVGLGAAALIALALGALVAAGLARWIARPLRDLRAVTERMGEGDVGVRAVADVGVPEVQAVAAAFNDMAARIGVLLDNQREMTADVSHQLRTPLAALRLRLELLADDAPEEMRGELLDALREIARLSRLADGLLAVARAEEVTAPVADVDVEAVVAERIDLWCAMAEDRGVALTARTAPATARSTPGHLEQVLDNVLANAFDVLGPGNSIVVTLDTDGETVVLTVADDGPGMPAHRRESALGRFVGDRAERASTGLGLAIVARLIGADGGAFELLDTPGGGLTAVVRLRSASVESRDPLQRA